MARAWKKPTTPNTEQQPTDPQTAAEQQPVSLDILEEALAQTESRLKAAYSAKRESQRTFSSDPIANTVQIRGLDDEIANLKIHADAIRVSIEDAETAEVARKEAEAIAASKANREAALRHTRASIPLALNIDIALSAVEVAVTAFRKHGDKAFETYSNMLSERYGVSDRMLDWVCLVEPRATGSGADVAAALAEKIARIIDIMKSNSLDNWIMCNQFRPKGQDSIRAAAERDAQFLIDQFGEANYK